MQSFINLGQSKRIGFQKLLQIITLQQLNNQNMNKGSWGGFSPASLYTYNIKIVSVKMKIKFQCKMKIQLQSNPITSQVSAAQPSIYVFNQECALIQKDISQNCFSLSVTLITSKGVKYIAGVATFYTSQLARLSQSNLNSRLVVALSKCLDPEAVIEILVRDSVKMQQKQVGFNRNQAKQRNSRVVNYQIAPLQFRRGQNSPPLSPRGRSNHGIEPATRSQVYMPHRVQLRNFDNRTNKKQIRQLTHKQSVSRAQQLKQREKSYDLFQNRNFGVSLTDRDILAYDFVDQSIVQDQVLSYKESFSKLKQKLKKQEHNTQKQHEKRVSLQNNEASIKIQAFKYRLKCDELQKNLVDRNSSIKKLQLRIEQLQKLLRGESVPIIPKLGRNSYSSSTLNIYQQARSSQGNDSAIIALQTKISLANKQLEELKNKIIKINKTHSQKQNSLMRELEAKRLKILQLEDQLTVASQNKYISKNEQSFRLNIESQAKTIASLQKDHEDYLRQLGDMNKANKTLEANIEQMRYRAQQLKRQMNLISNEKAKLSQLLQAQKNKGNIAQLSISNLKKNIDKLQNQVKDLSRIKQKYQDCLVQIKKIEGERKLEHKNYEQMNTMRLNNFNISEKKYQQQIKGLTKRTNDLENRHTHQTLRIKQLQNQINIQLKNQIENLKKANEKLNKEVEQYRNNERGLRKQHLNYESKIGQAHSELEIWKNKYKTLQNVYKLQTEKFSNQIIKLKASLEHETINQMHSRQKNQTMAADLAIANNKVTTLEEKYNRDVKDLQHKLGLQLNKNNKLQESLSKVEKSIMQNKFKQKQLISQIAQYGQNETEYSTLISRYEQQISMIKGTLALKQQKLNIKTTQFNDYAKKSQDLVQKNNMLSQKNQELNYEIKNIKNEFEREEREKQKLLLELGNIKALAEGKDKIIEKQKSSIQSQIKSKAENKQQVLKIANKLQNVNHEYTKFKDHVYDTVTRQFAGVNGLDSIANFTIKNRDRFVTLKQSLVSRNNQHNFKSSRILMRNSQNHNRLITEESKAIDRVKSVKTLDPLHSTNINSGLAEQSPWSKPTNNDIINAINQFSKQAKALLSKMIEQYRILEKELQFTRQNSNQKQTKYTHEIQKLENNLSKLKIQLEAISIEKDNKQKKSNHLINELQIQIEQLLQMLDKKKDELQQITFTCNGVKMQKQTQKQFYEMKINQNAISISKLQNEYETLMFKYDNLQIQKKKLDLELNQKHSQLLRISNSLEESEKKTRKLENQLNTNLKLNDELNAKNKLMVSQMAQLQNQLNSQREKNGKNAELISQQEKKLIDTKQFVNNLIKQKEALIKQDISNGNRIIELQSIKNNLENQIENFNIKLQSKNEQIKLEKDNVKKLNSHKKQLEKQLSQCKQSNLKLTVIIKQKQKQLYSLSQAMITKQKKHQKQLQTKIKELSESVQNNELYKNSSQQQISSLKKEIERLQEQIILNLQEQNKMLQNGLKSSQRQLESLAKNSQQYLFQLNSVKQAYQKVSAIREKLEQKIVDMQDEIREKDEQMYDISAQLYNLQQSYNETIRVSALDKEQFEEELQYKYNSMCEDYDTKINQLQKQKNYFRQKLQVFEEQQKKYSQKIKSMQYEELKQRAQMKQKIKKLQQEKNTGINQLKTEIKKLSQQKQRASNEKKKTEIELERLKEAEKIGKTTIQRMQLKQKQTETKLQQCQSQLLMQMQSDRKKELMLKQLEQSVQNQQWGFEREIKKELQNITKVVVGVLTESSQTKHRITDAIKDAEARISKVLAERISVGHK